MRADRKPQSEFKKPITDQKDERQNDESIQRHSPVPWVQVSVNRDENDRGNDWAQIKLETRSK